MALKKQLRKLRSGTVINATSKQQETEVIQALDFVVADLEKKYGQRITLRHDKTWFLKDIVSELRQSFPDTESHCHFDRSHLKPDGGFLCLQGKADVQVLLPILITEVKNQGTNDLRAKEGLPRQSKGNAIERLGKNVIGLRTALMRESIFPFVCFGYGCDFEDGSSILDRVSTIAMFGRLNTTYLFSEEEGRFDRGSFYFRRERWSVEEMRVIMTDIASRSILYYMSKYGEETFAQT